MVSVHVMQELFDPKIIRIIELFSKNSDKQLYLREISIEARVPVATTLRIVNKLVKTGIVDLMQIRKFKLYRLANNEKARFLKEVFNERKP